MKNYLVLILVLLSLSSISQRIWLTEKVQVEFKNYSFNLEFENRFDKLELDKEHTDVGLTFMKNNFSVNTNVRLIHSFDNFRVFREFRPHISLEYKWKELYFKPKIELRCFSDESSLRYKYKTSYIPLLHRKFYSYLAHEVVLNPDLEGNRFHLGIMYKKNPLEALIYYSYRYQISEKNIANIIGLSCCIVF